MRLGPQAIGTALFATICNPALAQEAAQMPAVAAQREWSGKVSATVLYDTHIARSSHAAAALRQIKPEDAIFTPRVSVNFAQPIGRNVAFLRGGAGRDYHRENPQLDRPRFDLTGGYINQMSQCRQSVFGSYRGNQSDLSDLDGFSVSNFQETTAFAVGVECRLNSGFGGSMTAQRLNRGNSSRVQREVDMTGESLSASASYQRPQLGSIGLFYTYSDSEFPNRILPGRPVGDGFYTDTRGISLEREFSSRLTVGASAARTAIKREFAPAGIDLKSSGTTYTGNILYRFGRRIEFLADGNRSIRASSGVGKLYDTVTSAGLRATYRQRPRIDTVLGYRFTNVDSEVNMVSPLLTITQSETHSVYGSIRYRLRTQGALLLTLAHDDRNTNLPSFTYRSTRMGLTAEVGF